MLMHNSSSSSSRQSGWCGDITRLLSESKLALPPLAPTVPHYQQPTSSLQGQTAATPPPTSSISHTHMHWTHRYARGHTYRVFPHCLSHSHTSTLILPFPYLWLSQQEVQVSTEHTCFHSGHPQRMMWCSSAGYRIGNHSSSHWWAAKRASGVKFCDDTMTAEIAVIW